jgi:hypothetical protein
MLFSPSAHFGGAWDLAHATDEPLCLRLDPAQEPALADYPAPGEYQHQGQRVASGQPTTQATIGGFLGFLGWAKSIAGDWASGRVQAVMELSGANPRPRLTGPLLPRGTAGPGSCGAGPGSATPFYAAAAP